MACNAKLVAAGLLVLGALASAPVFATDWSSQFIRENATKVINKTGAPVSVGSAFGSTTINSGTGGALIRAVQPVTVNGVKTAVTVARELTPAALGKIALRGARLMGPLGIASLVVEGIQWAGNEWMVREQSGGGIWYESPPSGELRSTGELVDYWKTLYNKDSYDKAYYGESPTIQGAWGDPAIVVSGRNGNGRWSFVRRTGQVTETSRPATDSEIENALSSALSSPPQYGKASGVLDSAVNAVSNSPSDMQALRDQIDTLANPTQVSGPNSVAGPSSTTTTQTSGGTETSTTTTTHNLSYSDNSVTITNSTTITHADGSITTIQTGGEGTEPDQAFCEKYPEIVACQKLGKLEPVQIERKTVALTMAAESGFGPVGAQCPADVTFMWQGKELAMSWLPICTFATGIRPIVLAVAWLSAALGFFAFARKGD